ncbi:MAG: hypothetical protein LBL01_00165, partial [Bifidobacteriaceae bacterium]|nr:hypothetical protein [Bifidobacteriaceae bacterium]
MAETRLGRVLRWAVALPSFLMLAVIGGVAAVCGADQPWAPWWLVCAAAGLAGAGVWRLCGKRLLRAWRALRLPKWALPAGLFAVFLAVKLVFVFGLRTEQQSDFLRIWQAAESIALGDYSFNQGTYWHFFAYQTPFAIYEAVMVKMFGASPVPLLAVNALAMAGVNLLVFLFARRLTRSAVAGLFAGLMYLAYTGPYLLAGVLTNDHLSTFLLYLGAWLGLLAAERLRASRRWPPWVLAAAAGVVLQLGNLARPVGPVVCAALAAALVLAPVMRRAQGRPWRPFGIAVACAAVVLGVYGLAGVAADAAVTASGVNPMGARNNLPEWKLVLGLSADGNSAGPARRIGVYEPEPPADAQATARALLKQNLRAFPHRWQTVEERQLRVLWSQNETASFQFWPQTADERIYEVPDGRRFPLARSLVLLERGLFLPAVLLAAWGVIWMARERRLGAAAVFLALFV